MQLDSPLAVIRGVGAQIAEKFSVLDVNTIQDLLYFFPRRYEDFSNIMPVAEIIPGKVTLQARIESVASRYVRRGLHITEAVLMDSTAKTRAVWYNQPYRAEQLKTNDEFYFSGNYELQRNRYVLSNPASEKVNEHTNNTGRIIPIYPETRGLKSSKIRQLVRQVLPIMQILPETLPPELIKREKLLDLNSALKQLHFPESSDLLERARRRMAFEETMELVLAALLNKNENTKQISNVIEFNQATAQKFTKNLPFSFTDAQKRTAWEILQDLTKAEPMNRLMQGDVGSGKTAVATMASHMAVNAGFQVAFMAPTEILANQHAETVSKLLQPYDVNMALLTGSVPVKAKQLLQAKIASGEVDLVIGTHALIQKDVQFKNLGLIIIDEQHRFGVEQRTELLSRGQKMPHLLSMTATPIPRSLQLTVYGELEISIINELPAGRQPIITEIYSPYQRAEVYRKIDQEIANGRQVYIVCPLVGEGLQEEIKNVEVEYKNLQTSIFKHRRLGLLHGQLKTDEKDKVMQAFKSGEIDILVATTVVEVGVDIPNATIMLIEGAERFGLAQLHQLRGRVGRGQYQSYCCLIPSSGKQPPPRLYELEKSQDGFYLAEADLKLRGPGEIYGKMQHGALNLKVANITDLQLIKRVREAAEWLMASPDNLLQYKQLINRAEKYRRLITLN